VELTGGHLTEPRYALNVCANRRLVARKMDARCDSPAGCGTRPRRLQAGRKLLFVTVHNIGAAAADEYDVAQQLPGWHASRELGLRHDEPNRGACISQILGSIACLDHFRHTWP
jgi:hypothetical protein